MSLKKNQQGAGHIVLILAVIVIAAIGFAAYRVLGKKKDTTTKSTSPSAVAKTPAETKKTWKDGEFVVKGTYADADVVQVGDKEWRMYYAIQPEVKGNRFEVYSATSSDGKTWKQESGTRKTMATFPDVVKTKEGKWRMYFQQAGVLKSAISSDGLIFTDEPGTRIDTNNSVGMVFDNVAAPSTILQADGTYMMVYRGTNNTRYAADTPNATTQVLLWATSPDGLSWTKQGMAVDTRNATLRGQLDGPDVVKWDDGKLHVFATNYDGVFEFIFDGSKFDTGTKAFALGNSTPPANSQPAKAVAPPGDPTLAKINGTWYMYYGVAFADGGIHSATLQ